MYGSPVSTPLVVRCLRDRSGFRTCSEGSGRQFPSCELRHMPQDDGFVELIRRVRAGDEQASAELVRLYEPAIRVAVRARLTDPRLRRLLDSTDVCQSVLGNFFGRAASGQFEIKDPKQLVAPAGDDGPQPDHQSRARAAGRPPRSSPRPALAPRAATSRSTPARAPARRPSVATCWKPSRAGCHPKSGRSPNSGPRGTPGPRSGRRSAPAPMRCGSAWGGAFDRVRRELRLLR